MQLAMASKLTRQAALSKQATNGVTVFLSPALQNQLVLDGNGPVGHPAQVPLPAGAVGPSVNVTQAVGPAEWHAIPDRAAQRRRGRKRGSASSVSSDGSAGAAINELSTTGHDSLFAADGDELEQLRVLVCTWNIHNETKTSGNLKRLLRSGEEPHDVYVVATQEFGGAQSAWDAALQEAAGPSFVKLHSANLEGIKLTVLVRRALRRSCHKIESAELPTKLGGLLKTKGAIGISLELGGRSLLFINSHLPAHQGAVRERARDYKLICERLDLPLDLHKSLTLTPSKAVPKRLVVDKFDHVFWMGDLNYRVERSRAEVDAALGGENWRDLLKHDQLLQQRAAGKVFHGFSEADIHFHPTYKFDPGSDDYDTSAKQRIPSWTDRILFKSRQPGAITCNSYDACTLMMESDHKPVIGSYSIRMPPGNGLKAAAVDVQAASFMLSILERHQSDGEELRKPKRAKKTKGGASSNKVAPKGTSSGEKDVASNSRVCTIS